MVKSPSFKGDPLLKSMFIDWGSFSDTDKRLTSLILSSKSSEKFTFSNVPWAVNKNLTWTLGIVINV